MGKIIFGELEFDDKDHIILEQATKQMLPVPDGQTGWGSMLARNHIETNVIDQFAAGFFAFKVPTGFQFVIKSICMRMFTASTTITIADIGLGAMDETAWNTQQRSNGEPTANFNARLTGKFPIFSGEEEDLAKYAVSNGYNDYFYHGQPWDGLVPPSSSIKPIVIDEGLYPVFYFESKLGVWDGSKVGLVVGQLIKKV